MHPHQEWLDPEIEEIWLAALDDAGLNADDCLLFVQPGARSDVQFSGLHFPRYRMLYEAPESGPDVNALVDMLNSDAHRDATRILVWRERSIEGFAAVTRHEAEHALQTQHHGARVDDLYHLATEVLRVRVGDLPGGGLLYNTIPNEVDANAAAAMFVRSRCGDEHVDRLLADDDEIDKAAFRSLVGPGPLETLPERLLAFFMTVPDLCATYAHQGGVAFTQLLDLAWNGAGPLWSEMVDLGAFSLPR